jgi:predicted component of type VI protein secretion system
MPWLTTEGAAHQIGEGETIVGSGPHAGWRLAAHDLAARHFIVTSTTNRVSICPASVEAVVAVNGHQIGASPVGLHDGDTIDAGSARFRYSMTQSTSAAAAPIAPAHIAEARSGVVHPLAAGSVGIGRDRTNAIVVRDPTASRFHAEIRAEAGGYVLHPRGSSGTKLNGRRVGNPERLEDGDRIEIAHVELRFVAGEAPPEAPRASANQGGDDESSNRRTLVQSAVMEIPTEEKSRSNAWIWILLAAVLGGTVYLAFK